MAVLKYYKVDADGKIERLRRECPQPEVSVEFQDPLIVKFFADILNSVALVSSWLLCITVNTAAAAILPTSLMTRNRALN